LTDSINAIFFLLNHPLICFSREIAAFTSVVLSKYISRVLKKREKEVEQRFLRIETAE